MTNEMKLLTTLCEALGFKVLTILDYDLREESPESAAPYFNTPRIPAYPRRQLLAVNGKYVRDADDYYTSQLVTPEVSFELVRIDTENDDG